jgi:hypothetical protein
MIVSYVMSVFDEIQHILKQWLPNIKMISPEEFKNDFLSEIKDWVERQKR